jgi:hypothetical protein
MNYPLPCPPSATPEEQERGQKILDLYRQGLPRLLAEGHGGRYALIRDNAVVSIWDTQSDAIQAGRLLFGMEPIAVQKINPSDVQRFTLLDAQCPQAGEAACPS